MFTFKLVRIRFFSPITFQSSHVEVPWRVPSDYLIRALTYAYSKMYDVSEWFSLLEQDIIRVSSLALVRKDKIYFPEYGQGYVSLDGEVIDLSDLVIKATRVRIPRIEGFEPTPFEDYQLLAPRYDWAVILGIRRDYYEEVFRKVLASLRFLGDVGIGARKARGSGRFKVVNIDSPENYSAKIAASGPGKLISRYVNSEGDLGKVKAFRIYRERTRVYYGDEIFKELEVAAEGSEIEVEDNGLLDYFVNDLMHRVPLYYRPLLIAASR